MCRRRPYPSDLTDGQWARASRFVPTPKKGGRPAKYDRREIANAVLYVERTGCRWRALPVDLPPWRAAYWYYMQWKKDGIHARLLDVQAAEPPCFGGS
jgi:transposase